MNINIIQSDSTVLLVGGGECENRALLSPLGLASRVVAADGGAARLLELGVVPDAVIGDMDSLPEHARSALPEQVLHEVREQDSTDFDKCLRHIEAPLILGYGFLGARLDHQLSALNVLVRRPDKRCVLVGPEDVACCCPPALALDRLAVGARVSLFPMGEITGRSEGLRWPIGGLRFSTGGVSGTSNEATGPVRLEMDGPGMILILPVACLDDLLAGLESAPRWPVSPV